MPPSFTRDFQRTLLRIPGVAVLDFAYGRVTLYARGIPPHSTIQFVQFPWSYNTTFPFPLGTDSVCRVPCSIAFTSGISFDFFSSPY